jgi:hypothetical protein
MDNELSRSCSLDKDEELRGDDHMGWDCLPRIAAVGHFVAHFNCLSGDREVRLVEFHAIQSWLFLAKDRSTAFAGYANRRLCMRLTAIGTESFAGLRFNWLLKRNSVSILGRLLVNSACGTRDSLAEGNFV